MAIIFLNSASCIVSINKSIYITLVTNNHLICILTAQYNWPNFTNPRIHQFHIPQCPIQNRNVHNIRSVNGALWNMEQVHSGSIVLGHVLCGCLSTPIGIGHLREVFYEKDVRAATCHDDVIKEKHFPRYWPFVWGIHRSRWIPHTKASDAELWCFLWSASE